MTNRLTTKTFLLSLLSLLPALPAAALTPAIPGPEIGIWDCLDPTGTPQSSFEILDHQRYRDPLGAEGAYTIYGWGQIGFDSGVWANSGGTFVPEIMALILPDAGEPTICTKRPG